MREVILETLLDSVKLLPFLFVTFILIELFEHKFSKKGKAAIEKSGKFGPFFGSILGIIPQCGFSVAATNFYATRIITIGTLFAVYLSTSDEMLPLLIAEQAPVSLMIKILLIKFIIGIVFGFLIDFVLRKKEKPKYDICDSEHCDCKNGIIFASIKHTLNIFTFIVICTFLINIVLYYFGSGYLEALFLKDNILGVFITSLTGLIPNCAGSVVLTELFLNGAITFGALIGGLLTGAGVGLLILFKENKNFMENIKIISILYLIGVFSGSVIELVMRYF